MSKFRQRLVPPRLRAYGHVLGSHLPLPMARLPHATHLIVTWRCNLRCGGCSAWQRPLEDELTAAQWGTVFAQLPSLDVVKIIGGEPFARPDIADVVLAIRDAVNPLVLQLVTNGTLTDEIVAFAQAHAWPQLHLRVSLDGLGQTHDRARGVGGTFEQTMATLTALAALRQHRKFQLAVNFTVTDDSLPDMQALIDQCRALDVDVVPGFKVRPFLKHCNVANEDVSTIGVVDKERALNRLVEPQHGARNGFNKLEQRVLKLINRVVFGKHATGGSALKFHCQELRHLMYLNPYGELITCGLNHDALGNLLTDGFPTVWNSPRARAARQAVVECPGCMQGAVEIMSRLYG
jgi:MoaA/NifB/PqqE/SkfB family radical SAM enzyme